MCQKISSAAVQSHVSISLLIFALLCPLLLPLRASSQVAGPGSDNPRNLPGQPVKPPGTPPPPPPEPTDPQVKAVIAKMSAVGVLHPKTLEEARRAYLFYAQFAGPGERVFQVENRQIPGPAGNIPIRLYASRAGGGLPVLVFFHGGGFVTGNLDTHDPPLRAIANRCDCLIVSVGYRLAPENHYPAATDDAYAATKWVADHAAEIGGDATRIAVGGDGAGGNIAAVVTLMARDRGAPRLVYQVLIYPILDSLMLTHSWVESHDPILTNDAMLVQWASYVPVNTDPANPYTSPLNADLRKLPPAFIITDADDPLLDEDQHYAANLKTAGIQADIAVYPNAIHGFFLMAGQLDTGKKCLEQIGAALKQTFQRG
jgi:acetyl esterase